MNNLKKLLLLSICVAFNSCYNQGPGYKYSLFDNTPNEELANAVEYEDVNSIKQLVRDKHLNIDFKEPKMGITLLKLAVGTQKSTSVKALLELGANPNIRTFTGNTPLLEATEYPQYKPEGCETEIIKLLLQYGADKDATSDSSSYITPLSNATSCMEQFRVLLSSGANLYYAPDKHFIVWSSILNGGGVDEELSVLKYLVIEKKYKVPRVINRRMDGLEYDIWFHLDKMDFPFYFFWKGQMKDEIVTYLKKHPEQFCDDCSGENKVKH